MRENILGTEKISRLFIKFSIPAIISMVIAGIQTIIDGIFLGNFVGQNALASVNIIQPFVQAIIGFSMIISVGSLSFLGRSLGEHKKEEAQNIFKTALMCIVVISLCIILVGTLFDKEIAVLLGANKVLLEGVSTYIKVISIFALPISLMFLFGFTNRVVEKPELYLKGMILSVIVNISLDFIFIKQLSLGIRGAALATGIAYVVAFFIVMPPMLNKNNIVNIFSGKFDKSAIMPMAYNGSSEGVVSIAAATTAYLFNATFMKIAGETGVAAFTIINYISEFGILTMFGVSDGIGPILSYNYGYKKQNRLNDTLKLALKVNLFIGVTLFFILFVFGKQLVSLFASGNEVLLSLAVKGSKTYAFAFLLCGFNIINSGYFTAIGDAKSSIIIAASRGIVFIILGINILPMIIGMRGVWLTVPFAECMTFIIGMYLFKKLCLKTV
ncbi:putative MATE family efflux protein [Clostridium tetanomorphum]|uniref:MATE family efflux transporter n=1 Tax=Clostridium tetanomorphum TaxID=1553 RepID=UPI00044B1C60|nr:MATE family efflux transporter [Clostridium tetanomorphum]KAJ52660.1 transmembrane cation efflux pump [Clostridium tetanomorphum DSM 665]MBP1863253.1 putative MATE family efflux protein [Clostridium tetanomorphum]NRS84361.1 putative MATE family efflux protein [Clostridium tetanomorphum]